MKQQKDESEAGPRANVPRYRHWYTPPETVVLQAADIEGNIPASHRIRPFDHGQTVALPAGEIFDGPAPKISLERLARLLPEHVKPAGIFIRLPAARLAAAYALVEHREELPPEQSPAPAPQSPAPSAVEPPPKHHGVLSGLSMFRRKAVPLTAAPPAPAAVVPAPPVPVPAEPALEEPARMLPDPVVNPDPVVVPPDVSSALPKSETTRIAFPAAPRPPASETTQIPPPFVPEPSAEKIGEPAVPFLETEHLSTRPDTPEISDPEPLQALFLTEERMSVDRVLALCGDLPGINSCVLTCGTVVVASHNAPESVDLISMSAHAADMLRVMRESSARMGVGTVPAVTLHTEKGVISFFHREDLTMLVFHKDRGFVPGVREKMVAVMGELAKVRLTLPAGSTRET